MTETLIKRRGDHVRYFKLYKKALKDLQQCEHLRDAGTWGIGARPITDEYARRWQQIRMRVELLEAYFENRKPNWFQCYYLSIEEMQRRNAHYEAF